MKTASVLFWPPSVQKQGLHIYKKLCLEVCNLPTGRYQSLLYLLVGAEFAVNQAHPTKKQKRKKKKNLYIIYAINRYITSTVIYFFFIQYALHIL